MPTEATLRDPETSHGGGWRTGSVMGLAALGGRRHASMGPTADRPDRRWVTSRPHPARTRTPHPAPPHAPAPPAPYPHLPPAPTFSHPPHLPAHRRPSCPPAAASGKGSLPFAALFGSLPSTFCAHLQVASSARFGFVTHVFPLCSHLHLVSGSNRDATCGVAPAPTVPEAV